MESAMPFNIRRFWAVLVQLATIGSFLIALIQVAPTALPPRLASERTVSCDASSYDEKVRALQAKPDRAAGRYVWLGASPDHSIFYDQETRQIACVPHVNPGQPMVRSAGPLPHTDQQTQKVLLVGIVIIAMCGMGMKICHWIRDARDGK
jgi:hypothetical protein